MFVYKSNCLIKSLAMFKKMTAFLKLYYFLVFNMKKITEYIKFSQMKSLDQKLILEILLEFLCINLFFLRFA